MGLCQPRTYSLLKCPSHIDLILVLSCQQSPPQMMPQSPSPHYCQQIPNHDTGAHGGSITRVLSHFRDRRCTANYNDYLLTTSNHEIASPLPIRRHHLNRSESPDAIYSIEQTNGAAQITPYYYYYLMYTTRTDLINGARPENQSVANAFYLRLIMPQQLAFGLKAFQYFCFRRYERDAPD